MAMGFASFIWPALNKPSDSDGVNRFLDELKSEMENEKVEDDKAAEKFKALKESRSKTINK